MGWPWLVLPALWLGGGAWNAASGAQVAVGLVVMVLATMSALRPLHRVGVLAATA